MDDTVVRREWCARALQSGACSLFDTSDEAIEWAFPEVIGARYVPCRSNGDIAGNSRGSKGAIAKIVGKFEAAFKGFYRGSKRGEARGM